MAINIDRLRKTTIKLATSIVKDITDAIKEKTGDDVTIYEAADAIRNIPTGDIPDNLLSMLSDTLLMSSFPTYGTINRENGKRTSFKFSLKSGGETHCRLGSEEWFNVNPNNNLLKFQHGGGEVFRYKHPSGSIINREIEYICELNGTVTLYVEGELVQSEIPVDYAARNNFTDFRTNNAVFNYFRSYVID